jgi:hypothetical protein
MKHYISATCSQDALQFQRQLFKGNANHKFLNL